MQSFCFYGNRRGERKKAQYLAEAYSKVFPAGIHYFEISKNKQTQVRFGKKSIEVVRMKGGYQISIGNKRYFYATSDEHDSKHAEIIHAPWLSASGSKNQLAQGSITFPLD